MSLQIKFKFTTVSKQFNSQKSCESTKRFSVLYIHPCPGGDGPREAPGGPRPVGPPGPPQRPPGTLDSYCINNNSKEDEATLTARPQVDTLSSP